jgi:SanA protein
MMTGGEKAMRWAKRAAVAGCVLLIACAGINLYVGLTTRGSICAPVETPAGATTVLVPGAMVYSSGALSHVLEDRIETALALYEAGRVKKFLLSGDHGTRRYDEVNSMKKYLLAKGVPPRDIFLDHAGFETYDSIYRAKEVFGAQSLVICTQRFHIYRSLYIARALGVDAAGVIADRRVYRTWPLNELREFFSRIKAFFKTMLLPAPRFLGKRIPMDGDGRASWD